MSDDAVQRAIKYYALFFALSVLLAAVGTWLFVESLRPIPTGFLELSGPVIESHAFRNRGAIHDVRFSIKGSAKRFFYPDIFPSINDAWREIQPGSNATISYTLDGSGKPVVWGLSINGHALIDPSGAYRSRRTNGYWGLAVALSFFACAVFFYRGLRRVWPNKSFKPNPLRGSA